MEVRPRDAAGLKSMGFLARFAADGQAKLSRSRVGARPPVLGALLAFAALLAGATPVRAQDPHPELSLPIACTLGESCFVQNYVDIDPSGEVRDFACGEATYDGHKGTDFRVQSAAAAKAGVDVLASADGTVKGTRDGMEDIFARKTAPGALAGRECGNGVVIDHGGGWETQYCHMLKGSVAVKSGDKVLRGQRLGQVGFSGFADFAHVHLEVRKDGKPVDPFLGAAGGTACIADPATAPKGLWTSEAAAKLGYKKGTVIRAAFSGSVPELEALEIDDAGTPLTASSQQLVFFARLINLAKGDRIRFSVTGPEGFAVDSTTDPLDRNKASYMGFAGKKLRAAAWPAGQYEGTVQIVRGGAVAAEQRASFRISH